MANEVLLPVRITSAKQVQAAGLGAKTYIQAHSIGLAPPPAPTPQNPQQGRTLFGIPLVDVGVGAAVLGAGAFFARRTGVL